MRLRLQFPPDPANAGNLARIIVDTVRRLDRITLDYSPASLKTVDSIVQRFREQGSTSEQMAETLFSFGCYVGEVLVKHIGGSWVLPPDSAIPKNLLQHFPFMVVQTPKGMVWNPIGKVFKLCEQGTVESTEYFFHVALGREAESAPTDNRPSADG